MFRAMKGRPPIGGVKSAVMAWPFSYSIQTKYKNGQQKIQKDFLGYVGIMIAIAFGGGKKIGKTLDSFFYVVREIPATNLRNKESLLQVELKIDLR